MFRNAKVLKLLFILIGIPTSGVQATGHFPHESGTSGDWRWKDISGFYSAHTNGLTSKEHLNVFCNDPKAVGNVSLNIAVSAAQVGNKKLTFEFDNGERIDVIANYGTVTAKERVGAGIIGAVLNNLRTASSVRVTQEGAPPALFSLSGSSGALGRC